jgi:hypothetical protein
VLVKYSLGLAVALTLVASAAAAIENAPVRHHRQHHATQPAQPAPAAQNGNPDAIRSPLRPYPHPGDGDNDGLSRDTDDCNKGCIGGNPG